MIGFDDQNAGLSDSFPNKGRDVSEVRYPGQTGPRVEEVVLSPLKIEPDRVVCIMRYAEWVDVERFERKRLSGLKNFPIRASWQLGLDCLDGIPVCKDGQPAELGKTPDTCGMIIVFVCEKNSVQLLDRNAFLTKQKLKLLA